MKLFKKNQTLSPIYFVDVCFRCNADSQNHKWFSVKFNEYASADKWAAKVIERFKEHTDFPLEIIIVAVLNSKEESSPTVIDTYMFPEIYYAIIEICKMYHEGPLDTFVLQKPCASRQEATAFIERVGNGKKHLYSVNYAYIDTHN